MKGHGAAKQGVEAIMRITLGVFLAVTSVACVAGTVDLGGGDAAPPEVVEGGASVSARTTLATCSSAAEMSATLGNGFNYETPAACTAAQGPAQPVTSAADVASLLVGLWYDCTHKSFGIDVDEEDHEAIQLTSDGHYVTYGGDSNWTLVPLPPVPDDPDVDAGGVTLASTGTFTVVDGSATYGAGSYELQLHPANGGLFTGQVVVTTSPVQLHFFPTNGAEQVFTPPLPWSPRAGVCSCVNTTETPSFENDPVGLASAIVGRWLWCAGGSGPFGNIGIEFAAGGAWYELNEDQSGNVARGTGSLEHGTFTVGPTSAPGSFGMGPEPLTVNLDQGSQSTSTQVLYFANPRVLKVAVATGTTGAGAPLQNIYTTCFPMP
jgi:hypothetical protein